MKIKVFSKTHRPLFYFYQRILVLVNIQARCEITRIEDRKKTKDWIDEVYKKKRTRREKGEKKQRRNREKK